MQIFLYLQNSSGLLIEIMSNLQINLGIFTMLSFLLHEHSIPLHLFRSLISFINISSFPMDSLSVRFIRFILSNFLSHCRWNCIFHFGSNCSLLAHRKTIDFLADHASCGLTVLSSGVAFVFEDPLLLS
jgi:hypothetical protein